MDQAMNTLGICGILPILRGVAPADAAAQARRWAAQGVMAVACPPEALEAVRAACPGLLAGVEGAAAAADFSLLTGTDGGMEVRLGGARVQAALIGAPEEIPGAVAEGRLPCILPGDSSGEEVRRWIDALLDLKLAHVGVNAPDPEADRDALARLMDVPVHDGPTSIMCGPFELMKNGGRGRHGHFGFTTPDAARAVHYLSRRGFSPDWDSVRYGEQGELNFIYFLDEIGGFAFHVMNR